MDCNRVKRNETEAHMRKREHTAFTVANVNRIEKKERERGQQQQRIAYLYTTLPSGRKQEEQLK